MFDSGKDMLSRQRAEVLAGNGGDGTNPESGGCPGERLRGTLTPVRTPCTDSPKKRSEAEHPDYYLHWEQKQGSVLEPLAARVPVPTLLQADYLP